MNTQQIVYWGREKKINDPYRQLLKTLEELGEVSSALLKNNEKEFKDGIGDVIVTLIILADIKGTSIEECLEIAWNEIKNRKGKTIDGTFIKE